MRVDHCLLLACVLLSLPACTLHSALQPGQRLVQLGGEGGVAASAQEAGAAECWRPATPDDLVGAFASVEIRGVAAASVRQMSYCFGRDGHYTGSALMNSALGPRHEVIAGDWQLRDGMLCLGRGSPPAPARVRGPNVELSTDLGTVLLARTR